MKSRLAVVGAAVGMLILAGGAGWFLRAREERLSNELFRRMLQYGAESDGHDPEDVKSFIREHPSLANRQFSRFVERPLHRAAKNAWTDVCRVLIDCGADVEARDFSGQ